MSDQATHDAPADIPRTALPALRDVVLDAFDADDLRSKSLEFNVEFAAVVRAGVPAADQVLDLLAHFRKRKLLGRFLDALAAEVPDHPDFRKQLAEAIRKAPPAPEDGPDEAEEAPAGRRLPAWLLPAAAIVLCAGAAFAGGRYLGSPAGPSELVIHLRDPGSSTLGGVYVKYDSVSKGPEQLAEKRPSGEYHIAIDDITPQTGISFERDPASAEDVYGTLPCIEDCFKILKVDYRDPKTLFLFLEESRDDR